MLTAVRKGQSLRMVAKRFGVSKSTVERWVRHADDKRLDRVDFSNRPSRPIRSNRTDPGMEDLILDVRRDLKDNSPLGEHGAEAIYRELLIRGIGQIPSLRTIGRILERRGALDGKRRIRRAAPPRGWYLPNVLCGQADIDSFDLIEDLRIQDGPLVDVLTAVSLHGRLTAAWPVEAQITAKTTLKCIFDHWWSQGLPTYAQFDNDTRFQGAHQHRDCISRIMRLCLRLGVTPVFTPPRETGFQAAIENFNRRWQDVVWRRFHHLDLAALSARSGQFIQAHRRRKAPHIANAPCRQLVPKAFRLDLQAHPSGILIYLRRCTAAGNVSLLGHNFPVDRHWPHRLVRCEVDIDLHRIRFFALRRRDPAWQPMLNEIDHTIPRRRFSE